MSGAWVGLGLVLVGVAAACAGALGGGYTVQLPPPGPNVFEGTVKATKAATGPLGGDPYAVAFVRASVSSRGAQSPQWKNLLDEVRGDPRVVVETPDGPRDVVIGDPMSTWFGFRGGEETRLDSLAGYPELAGLPGQDVPNRLEFLVTVYGIRDGERLLVEVGPDGRSATRIWKGGREAFTAAAASGSGNVKLAQRTLFGVSGVSLLGGAAMAWWGWR